MQDALFKFALASVAVLSFATVCHGKDILTSDQIEEYSQHIVQVIARVNGVNKIGTGFLVDDVGHILTAAHNVLPTVTSLGSHRVESRTVRARLYRPKHGSSPIEEVAAIVLYVDQQTDLALLRAGLTPGGHLYSENALRHLELAAPGTLEVGAEVGLLSWEAPTAGEHFRPAFRSARIDSLFNPLAHHDGLIDISGDDVNASSSGAPLFDKYGYVAGVFTKGKRSTGEACVPISFAASLMHMAGVPYPSSEVKEVITELRRDLVNWQISYEHSTTNVALHFRKRLRAGERPVRVEATFYVFAGNPDRWFEIRKIKPSGRLIGRDGLIVFEAVGQEADDLIAEYKKTDRHSQKRVGSKQYAQVTVEAFFSDGTKITGLEDYRLSFEK